MGAVIYTQSIESSLIPGLWFLDKERANKRWSVVSQSKGKEQQNGQQGWRQDSEVLGYG